MWWSNKTSNSPKCCNSMFHMFHDFVVILYLSYYYHVAMFQGMRNSCCIHMLHYYHSQAIKYETNIIENVAYTCFSTMAWWDRWCTWLWNEMQFCGSQTPKVLQSWFNPHKKKNIMVQLALKVIPNVVARAWDIIKIVTSTPFLM